MAFKDHSGNFISADSADTLGEQYQERIPEENVCTYLAAHHFLSVFFS